jgi:sulfatase maturation enzyme AslB (radical SAM superfamily)
MNLYFYIAYKDNKLEPFILVSKYNLEEIKEFYKLYNREIPDIKLYFTNNINQKNKIKDLCIKYPFKIIKNNPDPFYKFIDDKFITIDTKKFQNTFDYLYNYIGYFLIFVSDKYISN